MSNNKFLEYLFQRIKKDNYRGYHLSQHNRLPFDKVSIILSKIYDVAQDKIFNIHIGDDKGIRQKNCEIYYQIVQELNKVIGQVTINSLKKNIFPDFDVMGFLNRFDKNKKTITREKRTKICAVQLTDLGISYVKENNLKNKYRMYIDATEKILKPIIDDLFYLLYEKFDTISIWEFMFIFSDDSISLDEKIELITISRQMTNLEHIKLRSDIQKKFELINEVAFNKTEKRDFGNWYNEALQIYNLLNQTIYFKTFQKTVLMLALSQEALEFRTVRSQNEKIKCLQWHEISMKKADYELHHIYPLGYAVSKKDLDLIDDYRNLIYISKELHKRIPSKNNFYVKLVYESNVLKLVNLFDNSDYIDLTDKINIKYLNIQEMIEYNKKILSEKSS